MSKATGEATAVEAAVHANESSVRKTDAKLDPEWMKALGFTNLDIPPQSLAFNSWASDPWTVTGTNGAAFFTLSHLSLTVTKAQIVGGGVVITYYFIANVASDGWTINPPGGSQILRVRLDLKSSQGGIVWSDDLEFGLGCGTNASQYSSKRIPVDVFDLITNANVSSTNQTFWKC